MNIAGGFYTFVLSAHKYKNYAVLLLPKVLPGDLFENLGSSFVRPWIRVNGRDLFSF